MKNIKEIQNILQKIRNGGIFSFLNDICIGIIYVCFFFEFSDFFLKNANAEL
jgi:hypothetical protein